MQLEEKRKLALAAYAAALALLILNDFFLKERYPGAVTGKLSDFAGLFAFAAFLMIVFPRWRNSVCVLSGLCFVFWKSPFSQPLMDRWNEVGVWPVTRVVDISDCIALLVLPAAWITSRHVEIRTRSVLAVASLFAFVATSRDPYHFGVSAWDRLHHVVVTESADQVVKDLRRCGMYFPWLDPAPNLEISDENEILMSYRTTAISPPRDLYVTIHATQKRDGLLLDVRSISAQPVKDPLGRWLYNYRSSRPTPEEQRVIRRQLAALLTHCLRR